jgi:hypothetical protein
MPLHDAVLEVEALQIRDGRSLDDFGQTEAFTTHGARLGRVEVEQAEFVLYAQVRLGRRRVRKFVA